MYLFAGDKGIFKSPNRALLPVFILGILISIPAIVIEYFSTIITKLIENKATIFVSTFFVVAPVEEYLKALAVDIAGYNKNEECNPRQILAWYFAAAIGFASIENVLYFMVFGSKIFFFRIILTTLAHACCSGIIGLFIGKHFYRKTSGFARGFFIATILHGIYDYTLTIYSFSIWIWVPLLLLFAGYLEGKLDPPLHTVSTAGEVT